MMRIYFHYFNILGLGLLALGCSYRLEKEAPNLSYSAELLAGVSYNMVKTEVFDKNCVICHGNSGGVNLESYESAVSALEKIRLSAIVAETMPKSPIPRLDEKQISILGAWIATDGRKFPASGIDDGSTAPTEPLEPKFLSIQTKILKPKCYSCHSTGGKAERVSLASVQEMIDSPLDILLPGNPEESGLTLVMKETARKRMPPRESGISAISPEDILTIEDWIRKGAKD